jgi:hypothetical protein
MALMPQNAAIALLPPQRDSDDVLYDEGGYPPAWLPVANFPTCGGVHLRKAARFLRTIRASRSALIGSCSRATARHFLLRLCHH